MNTSKITPAAMRGAPLSVRLARYSLPQPNGCILWTASLNPDGYGQLKWRGRMVRAHRMAWENKNGPVPGGLYVCHKCDVRACINPDHMFLGTYDDNMADMDRKGRRRIVFGSACGSAKLTEEQVREIRALSGTHQGIADKFGLTQSQISRIISRQSWAQVA